MDNWENALAGCEASTYVGYDDWRLPNINELKTLVNIEQNGPATDFPDTPSHWFWSSSRYVPSNDYVWGLDFVDGLRQSKYNYCFSGVDKAIPGGYYHFSVSQNGSDKGSGRYVDGF